MHSNFKLDNTNHKLSQIIWYTYTQIHIHITIKFQN